jgi:hypothetical protein
VVVLLATPVVAAPVVVVVVGPALVEVGPAPPVVVVLLFAPVVPAVVPPVVPLVVFAAFEVGPVLVDLFELAGSSPPQASVAVPVTSAVTNQVAANPESLNKKVRISLSATIVLLGKDAETKQSPVLGASRRAR